MRSAPAAAATVDSHGRVARDHDAAARASADECRRIDDATIVERDGFALAIFPHTAALWFRPARELGIEPTAAFFLDERITERRLAHGARREGKNRVALSFDRGPGVIHGFRSGNESRSTPSPSAFFRNACSPGGPHTRSGSASGLERERAQQSQNRGRDRCGSA